MVSSWLSKASALAVCAIAVSRAVATPTGAPAPAEEVKFDNLGQMHWDSDNSKTEPAPIGRPNFDRLDVAAIEKSFEAETKLWLQEAMQTGKHAAGDLNEKLQELLSNIEKTVDGVKHDAAASAQDWIHKGLVWVNGVKYEKLIHPRFPDYALRLSTSSDISTKCDPDVKSYSGYFDVGEDKHLWFAFFESRSRKASAAPEKEPVVMWLNGGPGCSSSAGWLMEGVGPCTIDKNGTATKYNEHSWTNKASVFFLDQPVNVGYSYSESSEVNNTPQGAEDVYAFLSLFFTKFPEYSESPFTIAAESYGGRYAPLYAAKIHAENKKIKAQQEQSIQTAFSPKAINLHSIMLGNGLTNPKIQFPAVVDFACHGKYALWEKDSPECVKLTSKAKTCESLIDQCYKYDSRLTCLPAALYCWSGMYTDAQQSGRNLYDVRKSCNRDPDADGPLCYRDETYVERYMNEPAVKKAYGVPDSIKYQACNTQINQNFLMQGDSMHDSSAVLPEMIEDGIRLLVYAGEADLMCSAIGNEKWLLQLDTDYASELATNRKDWIVDGKKAGYVRSSGKGAVAYIKVKDAGHMVPLDQPKAAQSMAETWLAHKDFA